MAHSERIIDLPEMRNKEGVFTGRPEAGLVLADMIKEYQNSPTLVLAIPAGGVPVALGMGKKLNLTVSAAVVSKITLPWNTESGYGAVAFDGTVRLNHALLPQLGLTEEQVDEGIKRTTQKVRCRVERFSKILPVPNLKDRTVFLVDDGLASGFTMLTAIDAVKKAGAGVVNIAVPTGHMDSVKRISAQVDAVYCPNIRSGFFFAVANAYEEWFDIGEEELFEMI